VGGKSVEGTSTNLWRGAPIIHARRADALGPVEKNTFSFANVASTPVARKQPPTVRK
jgi:hypothetical protein